jgi:hypothetical protein
MSARRETAITVRGAIWEGLRPILRNVYEAAWREGFEQGAGELDDGDLGFMEEARDEYLRAVLGCEPGCVYPTSDHGGPCVDDPPLSDPRPDPRTHPEYWRE